MLETLKPELEATLQANQVPFASFGVTDANATRMQAEIGTAGAAPLDENHVFRIASMTKPIVTLAALQLVARGDLRLDQPMKEILPELGEVQVVSRNGDELTFAPLARDITLHHLLTHTSGYAYDFHAELIAELVAQEKLAGVASDNDAFLSAPLIFQPGENWEYGINIDWAGRIVEKISGVDLNTYVKANILRPLGMEHTSFSINDLNGDALVPLALRDDDGNLSDVSDLMPNVTDGPYLGGGGLYSNVGDYMKFMRMVLKDGQGPDGQILPADMVRDMFTNQIGDKQVGYMPSRNPMLARGHGWFEGTSMKWGYGFMLNETEVDGRRAAGAGAWSGLYNTFFSVDRVRETGCVVMMQMLPVYNEAALAVFDTFERAVYSANS
jgi:CubicO group peptidase (beta-lactamase class C family)